MAARAHEDWTAPGCPLLPPPARPPPRPAPRAAASWGSNCQLQEKLTVAAEFLDRCDLQNRSWPEPSTANRPIHHTYPNEI